MSKAGWTAFCAVQLAGILAAFLFGLFEGSIGPALWVVAFVALLPGNVAGGWLVEKALWGGPLGLRPLALLSTICAVAINGLLWFALARGWKFFRRHSSATTAT
jgi:hypothetical protein